jgi:hypothetical protein
MAGRQSLSGEYAGGARIEWADQVAKPYPNSVDGSPVNRLVDAEARASALAMALVLASPQITKPPAAPARSRPNPMTDRSGRAGST